MNDGVKNPTAAEAGLFFLLVFLIYLASPVVQSLDSRFMLPTALSIVRHGNAHIDPYSRQFGIAPWAVLNIRGHYWNAYPIGLPFLLLPLAWVADKGAAIAGLDLERYAVERPPLVLELAFASLITAAAATLLFCYARKRLSLPRALLLGGLFAFATAAYSTASRGLWQHGPSMLLLLIAVTVYDRMDQSKALGGLLLGLAAGYSYGVRPSNAVVILGFALLVAFTARRWLIPYVCGAALGLVPLFAFNLAAFGVWMTEYYKGIQGSFFSSTLLPLDGLFGILISPSRGLLTFSPFLLFLIVRLSRSYRLRYRPSALECLLLFLPLAWIFGVARWHGWWGGSVYGPRLLCEASPCLVLLLVPVVENLSLQGGQAKRVLTLLFLASGAVSAAIHLRGASASATDMWNATPENIDVHPERLWDWRDPQFLRGLLPDRLPPGLKSFRQNLTSTTARLTLRPGQHTKLPVRVENPGPDTWDSSAAFPVRVSYRLIQGTRVIEGTRTMLASPIGPHDFANVDVEVIAPDQPGEYTLRVSLVQEFVAWFMDKSGMFLEVPVTVQ